MYSSETGEGTALPVDEETTLETGKTFWDLFSTEIYKKQVICVIQKQ